MSDASKLRGVELWALILTGLAILGSMPWGSVKLTLGIATGGILMAGNVFIIRRVVAGMLAEEDLDEKRNKKRRRRLVLQYVVKMLALLGVIGVIIKYGKVSPVGLLIGMTTALLALIAVGMKTAVEEKEE
jgi:NADH:ubiquinone oxidoreductase subunit 6 (subunit J)